MSKLGPITEGELSIKEGQPMAYTNEGKLESVIMITAQASTGEDVLDIKCSSGTHNGKRLFVDNINEARANAELAIDAHNTANRTGKLPSELEAERDELLTLLLESQFDIGGNWRERRDAAIAKSTGK